MDTINIYRTENNIVINNENNIFSNNIQSDNEKKKKEEMKKFIEENIENEYKKLIQKEIIKEECKIVIEKINKDGSLEKKKKKKKTIKNSFKIILNWFSCMINLLAIYQIISVKNALFDEIKDGFFSYYLREPRKQTFYKKILNETIRYIPEIEIYLLGQIFTGYFKKKFGFLFINFFCYFINSFCLIILIFFNFSNDLNKYYSRTNDFILIILFLLLYFCISLSSLINLDKCSRDSNIYLDTIFSDLHKNKVKFICNFLMNPLFLDSLVRAIAIYMKLELNKLIYKKFDYSIVKKSFLFFIFLIYFIGGLISILIFFILDYYVDNNINNNKDDNDKENNNNDDNNKDNGNNHDNKNDINLENEYYEIMEYLKYCNELLKSLNEKIEIENLEDLEKTISQIKLKEVSRNEKIFVLEKIKESYKNYIGKISYLVKRNKKNKNRNEIEKEDINVSNIETKVKNILNNDKNKIEIFDNIEKLKEDTFLKKKKYYLNSEKIEIMESVDQSKYLEKALNNKKDSYFQLIYEKEEKFKYFLNFLSKNNLWFILILYFFYNFSIINFYNIIEKKFIEKQKIEFLIHNYNKFLFFFALYEFISIMMMIISFSILYFGLFIFNFYVLFFYIKQFIYKEIKSNTLYIFLHSNFFNFWIQNKYSLFQGKDFLTVNAFFSVIDFCNFLFEFIIIDCNKLNEKKLKIISIIISSINQIFLLIAFIYDLYKGCEKKKISTSNIMFNFLNK